jgi:phage major head subunit gpT-like protein
MLRSMFNSLLTEGLRKVYYDQYKAKELMYPSLFSVESSKKKTETDQSIAGVGMLTAKAEGVGIDYENMAEGYSTSYTHTAYAKGLRFTRELIDDELYGVMKNRTKALARSTWYRKEYDASTLFNNAAVTTTFTGGDGVALLSTAHPYANYIGGGTQANTPAVASDLSLASLEAAITAFRKIKDDTGLLIAMKPSILLVPPELEFDANEIINSTLKPYTADNDVNYFKGRLQVKVWDFLTDSDSWFVLADKSDGAPIWFNRVAVEFDSDGDFDTKDLKVSAYTRYSFGFSDWRWVYGSMGAG